MELSRITYLIEKSKYRSKSTDVSKILSISNFFVDKIFKEFSHSNLNRSYSPMVKS